MRTIRTTTFFIGFMLLLGGLSISQDRPDAIKTNIKKLIDDVQKTIASEAPADQFFSSDVRTHAKAKIDALQSQGFLKFEISDFSMADLEVEDERHASLPVTVKWSTRNQEASKKTTLHFLQEDNRWVLNDVDFWEVSIWWFFFPLLAFAIAYGILAIVMYLHVARQSWRNARKKTLWQTLAVVPFAPFFYFHRKPWTAA